MSTPPDNNSRTPGQGLDTGTGGFPVGQNNELHSYSVDVEDGGQRLTWSPGNVKVDKSVSDLSRKTKSTLAAYLSDTTLGKTPSSPVSVRNRYPVNHVDGLDPENFTITDEKGYPSSPDRDLDTYTNKFVPGKVLESRSKADTNLKIKRGRQDGSSPDGNDLLPGVSPVQPAASAVGGKFSPEITTVTLPQESPVRQYYGNPNLSNSVIYNRFNPEGSEYKTLGTPMNSSQFAKKYNYGTSQAERDMSYGRLAQVGSVLSTRASAELGSLSDGYNPSNEMLSATLPGLTQLGIEKLNREELEARSVIDGLTKDTVPEGSLMNPAGQSWGALNNVNDQFSVSNIGMQLLAVALLVALSVVILAISALFAIGSPGSTFESMDASGRRPLGSSRFKKTQGGLTIGTVLYSIVESIGLEPTANPLSVCLPTGALLFFGMAKQDVTSAVMAAVAAKDGLDAVSQSPGYYAVLGRMIGRSFLQISDTFSQLGSAFGASAISGISQTLTTISTLKSTKFMKIVNVFSHLGDQYIDVKKFNGDEESFSAGFGIRFKSRLDKLSNNNALKDRMTNVGYGVNNLAVGWSVYRAPDLFIIPKGLQVVKDSPHARAMGIHSLESGIPDAEGGLKRSPYIADDQEDTRISSEEREKMERALEAEHVPFYLHDVRTNEIVSFHAFLASLSDDYTANYDQVESFGRVEPIRTYKSTNRKIGFSFYVAATNEADFNAMWLKINKLTTMVYPQFSEGRSISDSDGKYNIHMPFSQVIQAAPLVRLRIGDLITSNYSKFNLARLFGYTYAGTEFDSKKIPDNSESYDPKKRAIKLGELRQRPGTTFTTGAMLSEAKQNEKGARRNNTIRQAQKNLTLPPGFVLKVVKWEAGKVECEIDVARGEDVEDQYAVEASKKAYGDSNYPDQFLLNNGYNYIVNDYDLIPTPTTNKKLDDESSGDYSLAVREFMTDTDASKGNAIVRSFRSSGGKGLAGFIDSLSFDWYDKVTWEVQSDRKGSKAPKMCKVTVSFSPIHDITPGLDHVGANRAPIYTVKNIK
jgi:hypothetical protein